MKRDLLKIHLNIEVETANLDTFPDAVDVTLSDAPKDWRFQTGQEAAKAVNCVNKLFWESVCCAASQSDDAITSKVRIEIQCPEFSGGFHRQLVEARSNYSGWSPELSKDIAQVSEQIRHELADMLQNLAAAYYLGADLKSGEHYAFGLRY